MEKILEESTEGISEVISRWTLCYNHLLEFLIPPVGSPVVLYRFPGGITNMNSWTNSEMEFLKEEGIIG